MNLKLIIEDNLHKIDNFFKEKSKKDTYYIYIMIVGLIALMAYPFYDLSFKEFSDAKVKVETKKSQINIDNIFLKLHPEMEIVKIVQKIKALNTELLVAKENNKYIKNKIDTISALVYDEQAWGEYLSSVSTNAKKYHIKIINFTNIYSKKEKAFGHILDINLEITGSYSNTLKFINSLEKSDLVVDIHNLDIKAKNTLSTKLDISVWGITY